MLSEFCSVPLGRRPWDDTLTVFPGQNRLFMIGCMSLSKSALTVICPEIEQRIGHIIDKQLTSAGGAISGYRLKPPFLDTIAIASQEQVRNAGKDGVNPGEGGRFDYCAWDEPPEKRFRTPVLRGLVKARSRGGGYGREIGAMTPMNSLYVLDEIQRRAWNMGGDEPSIHVVTGTIHDNPSLTEEGKRQIMAGWDASEREAREKGHFLHLIGRVFPEVCEAHEYDEAEFDPLLISTEDGKPSEMPSDASVMCIADPHGRRRWVLLWIAIDRDDNWWVIREWPQVNPGQLPSSVINSPIDYGKDGVFMYMAKAIREVERTLPGGSERVVWREMDPNRGLSPAEGSGYDTVVRALSEAGKKLGEKLFFETTVSDNLDQGLAAVRNMLAWDATQPVSFSNAPKLRFSTRCRMALWSMHNYVWENWTDETKALKEKTKEIGKDIADDLRYAAMRKPKWRDWRGRTGRIDRMKAQLLDRIKRSG